MGPPIESKPISRALEMFVGYEGSTFSAGFKHSFETHEMYNLHPKQWYHILVERGDTLTTFTLFLGAFLFSQTSLLFQYIKPHRYRCAV